MKYKIISCYTKSYEHHAMKLKRSLERFKLPHSIEKVTDLGDWMSNIHYKADFVRRHLYLHQHPVIFLDADSEVVRHPGLFQSLSDSTVDIAAHYKENGNEKELIGSTLYFRPSIITKITVQRWIDLNNQSKIHYDQYNLQRAIEEINACNVYELPAEYCKIFDSTQKVTDPVIIQYQASRKIKNTI